MRFLVKKDQLSEGCRLRAPWCPNAWGEEIKNGALFVFSHRRHTPLKILDWDGTGLWALTKGRQPG